MHALMGISKIGLNSRFRELRPRRNQLSFEQDNVSVPIQPITGRRSLSLRSYTHSSDSLPCGRPALAGGELGSPCSISVTQRVRRCLFTGGVSLACPHQL